MSKLRNIRNAAIAIPAIGGGLFLKEKIISYHLRKRAERQKQLGGGRRLFGTLPRMRQRAVIYYRRKQLRDLEGIYKTGYKPRPKRVVIVSGRRNSY